MSKFFMVLITGLWLGLVIGLSFIEAPLKFRAPGITLKLGLGIGKLVFGVLNKIEIGMCIALLVALFSHKNVGNYLWFGVGLVAIILLIQSAVLLPVLDQRIILIQAGETPPPSHYHIIYIGLELLKVVSLFFAFFNAYKL